MTNILLSSLLFLGGFGFENEQKDKDTKQKNRSDKHLYRQNKTFYETQIVRSETIFNK